MVTVPGWLFKVVSPALILWGLFSLVVAYNRRALAKPGVRPAAATEIASTDAAAEAVPSVDEDDREVPADTPWNALISIVVGVGLFLFVSPAIVPPGNAVTRLFLAVSTFARAVIDGSVWGASWRSLPIYSYGVMLGLSLITGWYITLGLSERQGLSRERMSDCFIVTAFAAFAGSRVLYVVTNLGEFRDPDTHRFAFELIFSLRSGGLVAYGGFLGGLAGSLGFFAFERKPFWKWADAAVVSLASGLAITRIGCFLYGCDFGRPLAAGAPWLLARAGTFPRWADDTGSPAWQQHSTLGFRADATSCVERFHGDWHGGMCHLGSSAAASVPVHPTQIYESVTGALIFVVLVWLWRRRTFGGQIHYAFWVLYGFARAGLEILRDDNERGFYFGMSTSQIIGLATGVAGIAMYLWASRHAPRAEGLDLFSRRVAPAPAAG